MYLIAGLGNPGPRYAGNRHNIGFMAADAIARAHNLSPWRRRFQGETAEGHIGSEKLLVLKPMTFMNDSGQSVGAAQRFFGIEGSRLLAIYDELDLAPGKLRVKDGGGHAGHNGLRSIVQHIGPEFRRLRLGIGHPGERDRVMPHVLSDFAKSDRAWLEPMIGAIADNIALLIEGKDGTFQNKVHLSINPPPEKPKRVEPV